jgi:hypothetical protein
MQASNKKTRASAMIPKTCERTRSIGLIRDSRFEIQDSRLKGS